MSDIKTILSVTAHRPYKMPDTDWTYYQEWNNALFLHWKVPFDALRKHVPERLILDNFDGEVYISIVAFTMQKIRPKKLPAVKFISDFEEINVRTYIKNDDKAGVYFLSIEAAKSLSVYIAKALSGLPYEKSNIIRKRNHIQSINRKRGFYLKATFDIQASIKSKTELDKWLTERYCLYVDKHETIQRFEIHHEAWELSKIELKSLDLHYNFGNLKFDNQKPDLIHYSHGVKVIAWNKVAID